MLPILRNQGPLAVAASDGPVNRLSNLFDQFFNDEFFAPLSPTAASPAPLSMWDDENNLYVEVDAPGMSEKDIDVSVHNGVLLIRGERQRQRQGNGYDTRSYGRFEQRISLPAWARADSVEAKLQNGVLSLTFPKGDEAKPRRIALKTE